MNKIKILRLLVSLPKVSRLTACQFCGSNHMEAKVKHKSVFERYMDFQRENNVTSNCEEVVKEGKQVESKVDSPPSAVEIKQLDKMDGLGTMEEETVNLKVDETGTLNQETETQNSDDHKGQDNISQKRNSHVMTDLNKNSPYENDNTTKTCLETFEYMNVGESESKSLSNQDNNKTSVDTNSLKSNLKQDRNILNGNEGLMQNKQIDANPFNFVLNSELMPVVKSVLNSEDYILFHKQLEQIGIDSIPSVSKILYRTKTSNNIALNQWKKRSIELVGEERFLEESKANQSQGKHFHHLIHRYLCGEKNDEIPESIDGYWNSIQYVLDSIKADDVKMLEGMVSHPILHYRGGFDCIAVYRNTLCVIEWKCSKKPKPFLSNLYNYPLQAAAYLGAINTCFDPEIKSLGPVTNAVVVVAYSSTQPAHVHYMNNRLVQVYWKQWLQVLHDFWSQKAEKKKNRIIERHADFVQSNDE